MNQLILLDEAVNRLREDYSGTTLRLIKVLSAKTIMTGIPALFSTLLRTLLTKKLLRKDKNEILEFVEFCIVQICSDEFLQKHDDKISAFYDRLINEQLFYNTFAVLVKIMSCKCENYQSVMLMFFLYHAHSSSIVSSKFEYHEVVMQQLKSIKHLKPIMKPEDQIYQRWQSETWTAYSCLYDFVSPINYSYIKPNCLLLYSPLLDDLSFYEHNVDNLEMLEFLSRYSKSHEGLLLIIQHLSSSFLYSKQCSSSGTVRGNVPMIEFKNERIDCIVETIFKRSIVDPMSFIELNIFIPALLETKEYSDLVINKMLYLSRYYNSIDHLQFLVESFIDRLDGHLSTIQVLLDSFLSEYPDECKSILKILLRHYGKASKLELKYKKCSKAVVEYIESLTMTCASESEEDQNMQMIVVKELERLYTYVSS